MNQRSPWCALKGERANVTPFTLEAPLMRLSVASLRQVVKRDLTIQFVPQALTSYGGLELLGRYLHRIDLGARLRQAFTGLRSDYGSHRITLVLLALFYVGARRLEHLRYLSGDPLVTRFCGLARLPTRRTVADRLRELIADLRGRFGRRVALEFRMDAAFFQRGILRLLAARECGYAIKVGYWSWLPLKAIAAACRHWQPVAPGVTGHATELVIPQWQDLRLRVVLYRKHVNHETRRNFQLDLFTPDDGHYEYSAVATNLPLGLAAVWAFACGRGAQEKTFAELKGEFALDVVPTKHYAANSAWQQLSILAHNLIRSFQLDTLAEPKPRSRKRTYTHLFRRMRTLRFLLIARAGQLTRIGGRQVLRLTRNPATQR